MYPQYVAMNIMWTLLRNPLEGRRMKMLFERDLYFFEVLFESIPTFLILSIILWRSHKIPDLRRVIMGTEDEFWDLKNIGQEKEKALFLFTFGFSLGKYRVSNKII